MAILPAKRFESCARKSVGVALGFQIQDIGIYGQIALAAARGDHHVHPRQDFRVALDARRIQREPRRIGTDPLPGFHLALIALFGDLRVEIHRHPGMHDVGREVFFIDVDPALIEGFPVRVQAFTERSGQADTGDPDLRRSRI
jgi:hypothetical protein